MLIHYLRHLTGNKRSARANAQLGCILAFVAGAINAGGFLAVQQYTSHMTGIVSAMADNLALGIYDLPLIGLGALISFVTGAGCSAIMINYARRHRLSSVYAFPLLVEAVLLLCFGLLGAREAQVDGTFIVATMMLLSFIMGLQNAIITKLSNAVIRTTHVTGIATDIGIELGKMAYWNRSSPDDLPEGSAAKVRANKPHLKILTSLLLLFFIGGVVGALGFKNIGYIATVPLALMLMVLVIVPIYDDFRAAFQR